MATFTNESNAMSRRAASRRIALAAVGIFSLGSGVLGGRAFAQDADDCGSATLDVGGSPLRDYQFGTGRNVGDLAALAADFEPYGKAGTSTINNEWQRYQPFNDGNHHFTSNRLELIANADDGGVEPGGISSGQIVTKETFHPSGGNTLIMQLRAKIPRGDGTWPAFWLYSPPDSESSDSEIDIFEFFSSSTQDTHDWTGYDHGAGVGRDLCSIMTNEWVWHPGLDFAADYHVYTLVWKEGQIEKWVDDTLVKRSQFSWRGSAPQILINLAIGGDSVSEPSESVFPSVYSLDYLRIYEQ